MKVEVSTPHAEPNREPRLPVIPQHIYLVRTADSDSDLVTAIRVESLIPGDRVRFTWRRLD